MKITFPEDSDFVSARSHVNEDGTEIISLIPALYPESSKEYAQLIRRVFLVKEANKDLIDGIKYCLAFNYYGVDFVLEKDDTIETLLTDHKKNYRIALENKEEKLDPYVQELVEKYGEFAFTTDMYDPDQEFIGKDIRDAVTIGLGLLKDHPDSYKDSNNIKLAIRFLNPFYTEDDLEMIMHSIEMVQRMGWEDYKSHLTDSPDQAPFRPVEVSVQRAASVLKQSRSDIKIAEITHGWDRPLRHAFSIGFKYLVANPDADQEKLQKYIMRSMRRGANSRVVGEAVVLLLGTHRPAVDEIRTGPSNPMDDESQRFR